ncbi:MAG TPA: hypothetical protein VIG08_00870 [Gemmatimonadales bacterium]|jgi:uncharacterized membrane protein
MIFLFRLVHILAGAFWVGTALFTAWFLMPSVRALGPAGGAIMEQIGQVRRLPLYLMGVMILTILSGIALYWRDSNGFSGAWVRSGPGMVFGAGGVLGIIVAALGMIVITPAAKRLGELAAAMRKGGPPSPDQKAEMDRLQDRMASTTKVGSFLLLIATAAMAVARYVP